MVLVLGKWENIKTFDCKNKYSQQTLKRVEMDEMLSSIYSVSKVIILNVAQKIATGPTTQEYNVDRIPEIPIPESNTEDFTLGDHVRIKYNMAEFKSIQKRTLGWNSKFNTIHGSRCIVTQVFPSENSIQVCNREYRCYFVLYPGVLEKVQDERYVLKHPKSPWKIGDFVRTIDDKKVMSIMHKNPAVQQLVGKRGRVVGFTDQSVFVTFDGFDAKEVHPAALLTCDDPSPLKIPKHERGFQVGDQVKVISNLKKLIENQKDHGGWSLEMTKMLGKLVTVHNILQDGSVTVLFGNRIRKINSISVLKLGENKEPVEESLEFKLRDKVKMKIPKDIESLLANEEIPLVFLEYLRQTASIRNVNDVVDGNETYFIRYNCDINIHIEGNSLTRASSGEVEKYEAVQTKVKGLKAGDRVHLDVGPPNYVRFILKEIKARVEVIRALTLPATVKGFTDADHAVIEYDDGIRYKLNMKYLTVPEKFSIVKDPRMFGVDTIQELKDMITKCVCQMHDENDAVNVEFSVGIFSITEGNPSEIGFKINSLIGTKSRASAILKEILGWKIDQLCSGQFLVTGLETHQNEIKLRLIFGDDEYGIGTSSTSKADQAIVEQVTAFGEQPAVSGSAQPMQPEPEPQLRDIKDFRLLRFYDESLARDVYFPYLIHGTRRTPVEPVPREEGDYRGVVINNTYNIVGGVGNIYGGVSEYQTIF